MHVTLRTLAARTTLALSVCLAAGAFADNGADHGADRRADHGADADGGHDRDGHHAHCRAQRYTIVDSPSPDDCASPYGFCAAGVAEGTIHARTFYTLDGFSPAPATAPGLGESTGILVYTSDDGSTLTVRETGVGNMGGTAQGGIGASFEQVLSGTGRFAGATGVLYLASEAHGGSYYATVTGELCWE